MTGLEPAHIAAPEPKSGVSANSTTSACCRQSYTLQHQAWRNNGGYCNMAGRCSQAYLAKNPRPKVHEQSI